MQHDSSEGRNLILAIILSMLVIFAWQYFFAPPPPTEEMVKQEGSDAGMEPAIPDDQARVVEVQDRETLLAQSQRLPITSDTVTGSLQAQSLRFDDLQLPRYHLTVNPDSPPVTLLSPAKGENSYFAEFGWLATDSSIRVPDSATQWQNEGEALTPEQSITANWENGQGLQFTRKVAIEGEYLFNIEQRVTNNSDTPVTLYPYGRVNRTFADDKKHFFILHEGPLGVFNDRLSELTYEDLRDEPNQSYKTQRGWVGITDKYWLTALIPDADTPFTARMKFSEVRGRGTYQTDYTGNGVTVAPGETITLNHRLFAGAKKVALLEHYADDLGIPLFDRAVDFGALYFLTKPIFHALDFFNSWLGSFGLAILLLTVCIKLIMFPLANKSYKAMSQMKLLMPKIQELREQYGDDKMKLNQEVMALYKREKVNPASGCVPILIQIPVFFALYKVLFITIEMRHAPFYGWIEDLSAPDPTTLFNFFGLFPWDVPAFLMIGAWPLIMCVTMVIQQRLNPPPSDPAQAMVMKFLPFVFLFLFATF
ncbi:MAG: membrane protein insertase YidC, partial [Rickettsiales bacterium]|nr:membrane protein insertase YidC [Rickettsiales bacterium]